MSMNCIINMTMRMVEFSGRHKEEKGHDVSGRRASHEEMTRLLGEFDYHYVLLESLTCQV